MGFNTGNENGSSNTPKTAANGAGNETLHQAAQIVSPHTREPYTFSNKTSAMQNPPVPPVFSSKEQEREWIKFRLAQAFRMFAKWGYDDGIAGHITVRDPIKEGAFWVNPFGVHFGIITPDLLLLVDHHGDILDESGPIRNLNKAAFMIHSAIHTARPDVLCAAHSHSMYGRAFSALGVPLQMFVQNDTTFYNDILLYDQFNGAVFDSKEGENIAKRMGPQTHSVILQNHGLLTAHKSIEATISLFKMLEESCKSQILSLSAAAGLGRSPVVIDEQEAAWTNSMIGAHVGMWFGGLAEFEYFERTEKGEFGTWDGPRPFVIPPKMKLQN